MCSDEIHSMDWVRFGGELFSGAAGALARFEELKLIVEEFTKTRTKMELLEGALRRALLIAPISRIDEVLDSPQLAARQYWQEIEHPELGQKFKYPGPFVKFSETPITYRRRPPLVGEHNKEIYVDELGLMKQRLSALQSQGVI
jgi:crotonobetainyl-CoA:carnitine CoA-transferase CaiB-like acyl-CoA transferase